MKKTIAFFKVFIPVCATGAFISAASGADWGTPLFGGITAITLLIGFVAGFAMADCDDEQKTLFGHVSIETLKEARRELTEYTYREGGMRSTKCILEVLNKAIGDDN